MTQFIGIRSEGGLIPYDILEKIAREEDGFGQQAKNFGLPSGRRLTDEISRAWSDAQDYWHIFQRRSENLPEGETGTTLTRKWVSDLLNELLGYELTYQPTGAVIGGRNYPISHRAGQGEQSPPVHIDGFRIDIDRRLQGRRMSSQALVQEYLNNSDGHLWGIVTNGTLFRLLRDTSRTSRPTFLEFDLQSILDGNRFNEFALFYRVCHRSRLPKTAEDSTSCWLEKYFQISIEQGGRVRDKLRDGVEDALKCLGTGFLQHPKNEHLRERIKTGTLTAAEFHRQLLRLVYRLLFLMVAEERRMIVPEAPDSERRQRLYDNYYSIARLRNLAEASIEQSKFGDLWIGMQQTFRLFEDVADSNPLGIPPLNGDLFSNIAVKDIQETHLYNSDLLYSIHRLSLFDERHVLQRVNYRDLDVEELGSVYESLLDYQPVFVPEAEGTRFDLRTGSERKSTGSYYTRPELVRELIESALVPVMQDRLAAAKDKEGKQKAILSMSVCDPACGSGHFLLAAARRLGRELARIRTGEDEPTPKEFHLAVRDVIAHCIYGVDLNPLAVDLCKLALWLESHWTGKPLSFLDHRIKLGNSLVGVLDMKVLEEGIPDEAFTAITGDDKKVASAFKKRNKDERKGQSSLPFDVVDHTHHFAAESADLISIEEDTPADVRRKKEAYEKSRQKPDWWHDWVAANMWTAAFFSPLSKYDDPVVPTFDPFMTFRRGRQASPRMEAAAIAHATDLCFFHWPLEFPDVFERGGFDVVLGNPPWDKIKMSEEEHWIDDSYISSAPNRAARAKRLEEYRKSTIPTQLERLARFEGAKRVNDCTLKFIRFGQRFPQTATGDINTFAVFSELTQQLPKNSGRTGIIVPTGIATDDSCKLFFDSVTGSDSLVSLFDFENRSGIFPGVHRSYKFSLLTTQRGGMTLPGRYAFFLGDVTELLDDRRHFSLSAEDIALLNPNTRTCAIFRSKQDASLTRKLYRTIPVLFNSKTRENPWGVEIHRMFHMSDDMDCFSAKGDSESIPLYEAKLIHQFDHRWATFDNGTLRDCTETEKQMMDFRVTPRYWVPRIEVIYRAANAPETFIETCRIGKESEVLNGLRDWFRDELRKGTSGGFLVDLRTTIHELLGAKDATEFEEQICGTHVSASAASLRNVLRVAHALLERRTPPWFLGFRQNARATDERTFIATVLPMVGISNSIYFFTMGHERLHQMSCFIGNLNSLVLDYVVRQKVGGINLSYYFVEQFPILPPNIYTADDRSFIEPRVESLIASSDDVASFGNVGLVQWDVHRRAVTRAELDSYYAHLYGLTRDELRYVLDPKAVLGEDFPSETFRVLKEREEKEYGEYRTQRLVLEAFDRLGESPRFRDEMARRVSSLDAITASA